MPASLRPVALGGRAVDMVRKPGGIAIVTNREPLGPFARALPDLFAAHAAAAPRRIFLAERAGRAWRTLGYGDAFAAARGIGQALLDRGLGEDRRVLILAENGIDHALLALGAQCAGVAVAPVSPAYALAEDLTILRRIARIVAPQLVFAADPQRYARALDAIAGPGVEFIGPGDAFEAMRSTLPGPALERAFAGLGPDTVAKVLFTSASTSRPKGVITTQRMLCSNAEMMRRAYPFLASSPPLVVDWLPWCHTFGGSHTFDTVVANGGTYVVSAGRPSPEGIGKLVRDFRTFGPTVHFDVPRTFAQLTERLRANPHDGREALRNVRLFVSAGAGMEPRVWDDLLRLPVDLMGERIATVSSLGSTETAPVATVTTWQADGADVVGIPAPGVEMKLAPVDGRLEARFRGPNVTPGYLGEPALTAEAFDDEGFFRSGDAVQPVDPADPAAGFRFDGRLTEDVKLATGTTVRTAVLRAQLLAHFAPLLRDVAISAAGRAEIAALAFPDPAHCDALDGSLHAELQARLDGLAATATGSSRRIARLVLLDEPPSLAAGELTGQGTLNVRRVLERRAAAVEAAHAPEPPPTTLVARR